MAAVLVHIDLDGDRPHPSSLVALAAGRQVASSWGATLYAALIAQDAGLHGGADSTAQVVSAANVAGIDAIESALARGGADKVVVAMTDTPIAPLWAAVGNAWQGILEHLRPRLVLFGADAPSAPELGPRTAARIGARLLARARSLGGDEIELRDRDGGYVRVGDSGAAVAMIGRAEWMPAPTAPDEDIDVVVLALPGGADPRVELAASTPAELAHTTGVLVALGDGVAANGELVGDARRLAAALGARLVGGAAAAHVLPPGAVVDRTTPLAPELCIAIGAPHLDLAGATSVVTIGTRASKGVDAALPGPVGPAVAELAVRLEDL